MYGRLMFVAGAAVGYVLGARAGRDRYEAMKAQADTLWHDPRVQAKVDQAQATVKEKAPEVQAKIADLAGQAADTVKDKASDGAAAVKDRVSGSGGGSDDMLIGSETGSDYTPTTVKVDNA